MGSPSSNAICLTVCALLNHVSICLARSLQHYLIHNFQLKKIVLPPLKIPRTRWKDGSREVGVEVCVKVVLRKVRSKNKLEAWWCCVILLEKQAVLLETVLQALSRSKH